jgi:hypothetical protein
MANLRSIDMMTVDDLFIKDGYVLKFSDATYGVFFREELNVNIDDQKYYAEGGSKGKRLRYFLRSVDNDLAVRTLKALWQYREMLRVRASEEEKLPNAHGRLLEVLGRLGDKPPEPKPQSARSAIISSAQFLELGKELLRLSSLEPQRRGYDFEKYLKKMFDVFGLEARSAFRLVGEQIDGSFILGDQPYLLEAKWHNELTGASDLHAFQGKVDQRVDWARGLFVSYTGFSEQGLIAFRPKKVICLDGRDLAEAFARELPLPEVLRRKARRAVEHGVALARVGDLF